MSRSGDGLLGDVKWILGCVLIWALAFGVEWNGRHYGIATCDCQRGVVVDH